MRRESVFFIGFPPQLIFCTGARKAPFLLYMADNISRIIEIIEPIAKEEACEVVDAEFTSDTGRKVLRVYIDKEGGVQLGDCARVSHAVEDKLEVEDAVSGPYSLEVSSPGIPRPIRTREHFQKVTGQKVRVTTREKINDRKNFVGILKNVAETVLVIDIDGEDFQVPVDQIFKARLMNEI